MWLDFVELTGRRFNAGRFDLHGIPSIFDHLFVTAEGAVARKAASSGSCATKEGPRELVESLRVL